MAERVRFVTLPAGNLPSIRLVMKEYKWLGATEEANLWLPAPSSPTSQWEATGRTWQLDNRSGKALTRVDVAWIQAPSSRSRNAVANEGLLDKARHVSCLWVWPAIVSQIELDLIWARCRAPIHSMFHPPMSEICVYCTNRTHGSVTTMAHWNYDTRRRVLRATVLLLRTCQSNDECNIFQIRIMRAFHRMQPHYGLVPQKSQCHTCQTYATTGGPKFLACSGCWVPRYCSKACQLRDWPAHADSCRAIAHWDAMEDSYDACGLSIDAIWPPV